MNKSQRIKATLDGSDKYLQVKLEQNVDFLEILSLKIDQEQAYQNFNSDYGVLVGRVIANGGVGVPNAKISIFIPLSDDDEMNPKIKALYPYKSPQDKNTDGKRYNLLPRVAKISEDGTVKPKQPFGTFPPKEEVIIDDTYLEIYEKYYKFTTITNNSGDYMIFGVPVGIQTVHMSVDITDIGKYSMTPATMVSQLGYSSNLFTNNTRIKNSNDLADLPNIETQEISVDIRPFWGDSNNYEIGITRQDFRIRAILISTFTIFGTSFTDGENSMWGEEFDGGNKRIRELYRARDSGNDTISIATKRIGLINESFYFLKNSVTDQNADIDNFDPNTDYVLLSKDQYTRILRDGDFIFQLPCNRKKVITNEFGIEEVVSDDNSVGIFTEFIGFMTIGIDDNELPMNFSGSIGDNARLNPFRYKYKIPQNTTRDNSFISTENVNSINWRKQKHKFIANNIYSIATFKATVYNNENNDAAQDPNTGFLNPDIINNVATVDPFWNVGVISVNAGYNAFNPDAEFPANNSSGFFGGNWINFCIHFHQVAYLTGSGGPSTVREHRSNTHFTQDFKSDFYFINNNQVIANGTINTKNFARSDIHYTAFINVPKEDIIFIKNNIITKGFTETQFISPLGNEYKNGTSIVPQNGGRINGNPANGIDPKFYYCRGLNTADCIEFLFESSII